MSADFNADEQHTGLIWTVVEQNPDVSVGDGTGDVFLQDPNDAKDDPAPDASDDVGHNGTSDPVVAVTLTGNARIDGLIRGTRWSDGNISYSAPDAAGDYQAGYFYDDDEDGVSAQNEGFSAFSAQQMVAVHFALNAQTFTQPAGTAGFSVEGFTNLNIDFAGLGTGAGTMRFANSSDAATAYNFYPSAGVTGGDGFFGPDTRTPTVGNYSWHTTLHEIGHGLGLKHGHQTAVGNPAVLPADVNSNEYSIMTYHTYIGDTTPGINAETWGLPQTYMMLDIAALQYMYGADFTSNAGNTSYTWSPTTGQSFIDGAAVLTPGGNRILSTIWDGNGLDTYNLGNYTTAVQIDLRPGQHSVFSQVQRANLGDGNLARGNVFNALQSNNDARSLIENAVGGSGNDTIVGNAALNNFSAGLGNDTMTGGAGNDIMNGQGGTDTAVYSGGRANFGVTFASGVYTLVDQRSGSPDGTDSVREVEFFQFTDGTVTAASLVPPPDDYRDSITDLSAPLGSLTLAGAVTGHIETSGDHDVFATTLTAGQTYTFALRGAATSGGTLSDPYIALRNGAGTSLAEDDDGGTGRDSLLSYAATATGTYYVDAQAFGTNLGTYTLSVTAAPTVVPEAIQDFNLDGRSDLLWRNDSGAFVTWEMNGAAPNTNGQYNDSVGNEWQIRAQGDFDGDGRGDLFWRHTGGAFATWSMNGATASTAYYNDSVSNDWAIRATGDFNGDGTDDLLWRNYEGGVSIWNMFGTSAVASTYFYVPLDWKIVGAGDFNGDGTDDLLWRNDNGDVTTWQFNNNVPTHNVLYQNVATDWHVLGTGDFNGDNRDDILWRQNGGVLTTWEMNGATRTEHNAIAALPEAWDLGDIGDWNGDGRDDLAWRHDNGTLATWEMNGPAATTVLYTYLDPTWTLVNQAYEIV